MPSQALCILLKLLLCFCSLISSQPTESLLELNSGQLLDCTTIKSTGVSLSTTCDKSNIDINSTHTVNRTIEILRSNHSNIFSIDLNNILRRRRQRQVQNEQNCTTNQTQTTDVVCLPNQIHNDTSGVTSKALSINIVPTTIDNTITDSETLYLAPGSTSIIRCQFSLPKVSKVGELDFKLRWLRSITSQHGLRNQSITSDRNEKLDHHQVLISMNRIWTAQSGSGLDLLLNDVKFGDSGDYFCQAIASDGTILDEKRTHLEVFDDKKGLETQSTATDSLVNDSSDASDTYSAENLDELLPSLQVIPDYSELAVGEFLQLVCTTTGLDPDPEPEKLEWTFEPFKRPGYIPDNVDLPVDQASASELPYNTTQLGNFLIIWSMSYETIGIYTCSYQLENLNISVEASAEIALRPNSDSAPIVHMTPELLRLSAKGSARIQCESTGYPAPKMDWYRVVDVSNVTEVLEASLYTSKLAEQTQSTNKTGTPLENLDGLELQHLLSRDAMAYCLVSGCKALNNLDPLSRKQGNKDTKYKTLVTGLSWININHARAHHQGQYVCRATNKHGSNQASTIVDVEFKEMPRVEVASEHRRQTIVLESTKDQSGQLSQIMQKVTFNCSIKAGQPAPHLKWLRTNRFDGDRRNQSSDPYATANILLGHQFSKTRPPSGSFNNLELYDLTSISSATSRVSTKLHDHGKTLTLELSTISIDDEGDYVCLGENELGRHSAVAHLIVRKPAQVKILQTSPKIFRPNDSFQLDCLVSGHPSPMDIEWSRSDRGAFFALISRHPQAMSSDQEKAVLKFDRVTYDDSGEYTCAARDPLNQQIILKDTIMLMAEEINDKAKDEAGGRSIDLQRQIPKLLVRPTKIAAEPGSNVVLDCLAVSGLQPTVVEWLAPSAALTSAGQTSEHIPIRPYYRSQMMSLAHDARHSSLLQFGSRLKLYNVSRAHEGVYQCKGRNKVGMENAPAFIEILDTASVSHQMSATNDSKLENGSSDSGTPSAATKTKIAKLGTNIELRCQVNGIEGRPATSWSRENRELPDSSVQIDHNLWLQNLTKADEGLYLCSARSSEPDEIIQARIRLLVDENESGGKKLQNGRYDPSLFGAKIIASKTHLVAGDSVTLECMIHLMDGKTTSNKSYQLMDNQQTATGQSLSASELAELERQVIWTNLHSGQSLFQDNVYIQNNLLIIYDLRKENSATYRCNYNDLTQYTDHKLQVGPSELSTPTDYTHVNTTSFQFQAPNESLTETVHHDVDRYLLETLHTRRIVASLGDKKILECGGSQHSPTGRYFWTRHVDGENNSAFGLKSVIGREQQPLILDHIELSHAGLYQCNRQVTNDTRFRIESRYLLEVPVVAARFAQRPVSFVTLPAVPDADQQLELEIKFYLESDHGLMLFSGRVLNNLFKPDSANSSESATTAAAASTVSATTNKTASLLNNADYISLGLHKGFLEFRFELGDGTTLVRSQQPLELNQWHKVIIERNRRVATMWLDGQDPTSNSSAGKFFNLDLDSLLYVGGHQIFLTINSNSGAKRAGTGAKKTDMNSVAERTGEMTRSFYGYTRGFRGCISSLKINQRSINLMARNRSVSVGMFECDKSECSRSLEKSSVDNRSTVGAQFECPSMRGFCQVDRTSKLTGFATMSPALAKRHNSNPLTDLKCICFPSFNGTACSLEGVRPTDEDLVSGELLNVNQSRMSAPEHGTIEQTRDKKMQSVCDLSNLCSSNGTIQCEALSSSAYKCHCKLGFTGEHCDSQFSYANETSVGLNQSAFIQLAFNSPREFSAARTNDQMFKHPTLNELAMNETEYARLITFTEQQKITLKVKTRASYGLLFYIGQDLSANEPSQMRLDSGGFQTSKSIVANALARLSATRISDFLALALVDGHIELSYELGSGLAVLRSSKRYNDGQWHRVEIFRLGKTSRLFIDGELKHEAQSPGRLSMLNVGQDIYLGGLPAKFQTLLSSTSSSGSLLTSFVGCLSDLQINSLGPINLVRSDYLTKTKSARNLVPCSDSLLSSPQTSGSPMIQAPLASGDKISIDQVAIKPTSTITAGPSQAAVLAPAATTLPSSPPPPPPPPAPAFKRTTRKPTKPSYTTESDGDDSDELARSS